MRLFIYYDACYYPTKEDLKFLRYFGWCLFLQILKMLPRYIKCCWCDLWKKKK